MNHESPAGVVRRVLAAVLRLVMYADTGPTQFGLACVAFVWAGGLALPGDTFARPVYRFMNIFGNERVWIVLWLIYGIAMMWTVFSKVHFAGRLMNNMLGLALFVGSALAIFATRTYPFPAGIAPDLVAAAAAFWLFIRTGIPGSCLHHVDPYHG
jgi:hypothetical protein